MVDTRLYSEAVGVTCLSMEFLVMSENTSFKANSYLCSELILR